MKYLSNVGIGLILIALVAATVGTISYFQSREGVTKRASPPSNWQKFTDPKAGYSFYYPPNSNVQSGTSVETGYLTTHLTLRHDNGAEFMVFQTFDNLDDLPLETFIQTEKSLLSIAKPTDYSSWRQKDLGSHVSILMIGGHPALQVKQSKATLPLTGPCQQVTYIHHGSRVTAAILCPAKRGVWELGYKAKPAGEELYFQVLNTFTPTIED